VVGLRFRALFIGLLLLIAACFVTTYADLVIKQIQIGILQFAPAADIIYAGFKESLKEGFSAVSYYLGESDIHR